MPHINETKLEICDVGKETHREIEFDSRVCKKLIDNWITDFDLTEIFEQWNFADIIFDKEEILKY
jgi:hypothetical protein